MPSIDPRRLAGKARHVDVADDAALPPAVDKDKLQRYRLGRIREQMRRYDYDACLLFDAVNIRYACGARNMQIFTSRNPASRYLFVPAEGAVVLFEFPGCAHLAAGSCVDEVRPATTVSYVAAAERLDEQCKKWADEMDALLRQTVGGGGASGKRVGMEAAHHQHAAALRERGYEIADAQRITERARVKKSPEELLCIRHSLRTTEAAVAAMREQLRPNMSENALWSLLHQAIIAANGDYVETRLLSSGARTNPWFQECSDKAIGGGELVGLDTDVVGPFGYYADFSRTFHVSGSGAPTERQKTLYKLAYEQIHHNMSLLRGGISFREIAERAWRIPSDYVDNRYFVVAHGVGMTGEYPYILHDMDFDDAGYDGILQPFTTLCVESYIGGRHDGEGVKLEEQVLITENGYTLLSQFPYEEALLGREF